MTTSKTYTDLLPSANFSVDLTRNLIGRVAASRTMTRAEYTDLASAVGPNGQNGTGSGGNPQHVAGASDVSASVDVKLTNQLSLSLDAKNLAGALARQYVVQKDMPAAIYNNGKEFYLGLKYSM